MNKITTPAHRTAYVVGPFLSPFSSTAMDSDNMIAVASGKSALVLFYDVNPCVPYEVFEI